MRWIVSPELRFSTGLPIRSVASKLSRMYTDASGGGGGQKLENVEGLSSAGFAQGDWVGPMAKGGFEESPNRDGGQTVLLLPCFKADQVVLAHVNFRSVLNEQNALIGRNEFPKDIEHRGFS